MNSRPGEHPKLWYALAAIALVAGFAMRLQLASLAQTPGHGDSAFYYTVATNIVDGRGLVVDYVVYFFLGLVPLTHYAGDFWNPLAEILISLPMFVLGKSIFNALLASIAASMVPALVGFLAARHFSRSLMVAVMAGALTFFSPFIILVSVLTEAIIFYGAFGSLALFFAYKGRRHDPRYFLLAAMCTGAANLARQDGILLLGVLLLCILIAPMKWGRRIWLSLGVLALHAFMISPILIRNIVTYGSPLQPGPASTAFMTSYEDFHAYGKEMSWQTLRAEWGIRGLVTRRLHTAGENLVQLRNFADPILVLLASLGAINLWLTRDRHRDLLVLVPPLLYFIAVFAFYTLIASFSGPGSLPKSLAVLLPFASVLPVDLLVSRFPNVRVASLLVLLTIAVLGYRGYMQNYGTAETYNKLYESYAVLRETIKTDLRSRHLEPDSAVVMARDVWDVYAGTGYPAVMIPNNDLETIMSVAQHYGVDYMILPAPRKALEDIYLGTTPDSRFIPVAAIPGTDWRLFRIQVP